MALPRKMKITPAQLSAIIDITDTLSGMAGGWDEIMEKDVSKWIKKVDAFLKSNGLKRKFA